MIHILQLFNKHEHFTSGVQYNILHYSVIEKKNTVTKKKRKNLIVNYPIKHR